MHIISTAPKHQEKDAFPRLVSIIIIFVLITDKNPQ